MNKKFALCVGNNYPGTSAALRGCVNDMQEWATLLVREGYQVVYKEEASFQDTVSTLERMVGLAGYGDRVVFTFSGHGTWVPDLDGDEADGRDEALVMADYAEGGLLLDDHIQTIFGRLKTGSGALILPDACHSGTVSRAFGATASQARFMSPTEFFDMTPERARLMETTPASTPRPTASLISGCKDLEYSYDASFNGRPNGAFTRAAIDVYTTGISLNTWFNRIRGVLPSAFYPQTPQLTSASSYRKYLKAL